MDIIPILNQLASKVKNREYNSIQYGSLLVLNYDNKIIE